MDLEQNRSSKSAPAAGSDAAQIGQEPGSQNNLFGQLTKADWRAASNACDQLNKAKLDAVDAHGHENNAGEDKSFMSGLRRQYEDVKEIAENMVKVMLGLPPATSSENAANASGYRLGLIGACAFDSTLTAAFPTGGVAAALRKVGVAAGEERKTLQP